MNSWGDGNSHEQQKKEEETHAEKIEEVQTKILEEIEDTKLPKKQNLCNVHLMCRQGGACFDATHEVVICRLCKRFNNFVVVVECLYCFDPDFQLKRERERERGLEGRNWRGERSNDGCNVQHWTSSGNISSNFIAQKLMPKTWLFGQWSLWSFHLANECILWRAFHLVACPPPSGKECTETSMQLMISTSMFMKPLHPWSSLLWFW